MSNSPHRAQHEPLHDQVEDIPTIEGNEVNGGQGFDSMSWAETRDIHGIATEGGRQVLGWALSILALLWVGYTAWSAGRALATELAAARTAATATRRSGPKRSPNERWLGA